MSDGYPHGESHPTDNQADDGWCSVNEAARRLGVTPTAIRNRIKRRTLETKPNGNYGHLVRVPVPEPVPLTVPEPVTLTPDPVVVELRGQVTELQTRLAVAQESLVA